MANLLVTVAWEFPVVIAKLNDMHLEMNGKTGIVVSGNVTPGSPTYNKLWQAANAYRNLLRPDEVADA